MTLILFTRPVLTGPSYSADAIPDDGDLTGTDYEGGGEKDGFKLGHDMDSSALRLS